MLQLYGLTVEYKTDPLGLDEPQPRFSWKLRSDAQNTRQAAYRVVVQNGGVVWDSGKVESEQSILVEYLGAALTARTAYTWQVTVWDNHGETAEATAHFETGLLAGAAFEGKAAWITHSLAADSKVCPVFIKTFSVNKPVKSARLYATALGVYEVSCNGKKLGEDYFAPGWTNYRKRLQYQTYTVELVPGENTLEFTLGNGWYKGELGFMPVPNHYGDRLALLAALCVTYADGSEEWTGTDTTWRTATGPITGSEIYYGETQDTTLPLSDCGPARAFDYGFDTIIAQENEPVRCVQRLEVQKDFTAPNGDRLYDFGQNLTGWVEVRITGRPGQALTLRHAESLDENGNFYTGNLSFATATDTYVLDGSTQVLRPHFTFHGFRYICVQGLEDDQQVTFTACHLTSDLARTGEFTCSDKRVTRLQQNIQWSQRDNFLDVPTDCPQRSERLGWTGDVTAFCATAAFNQNIMPFMQKWLRDLASEQTPNIGMVQVVPNILGDAQEGAAFWGDAATVVPWTLYRAYGDKRILAAQYSSMKMWVDFIRSRCNEQGLWQQGFQYGDWLGLDAERTGLTDERKGSTDDYFAANICYARSLQIMADTAAVLGNACDEHLYRTLKEELVNAFRREYITPNGHLMSETQTAMILVLAFDMIPDEQRPALIKRLETNIGEHKTHLVTGFIGTPFACPTLSDNGLHELAGKLLLREENPGWLYEVKMGATTIWERWDSIQPDGSFNPANMNSLNHYAYGSIGEWLYTRLAGLTVVEPGYKVFAVKPRFIKGITWVEQKFESVYGTIELAWRCEGGKITVDLTVPANTTALLTLPEQAETQTLGSGSYHFAYATETSLELDRYTLETTLKAVLDHPVGAAVLRQYAPEIVDSPMLEYVMSEPLTTMIGYSPDAKPLFEAVVQTMNQSEKEGAQ